MVDLKRVNEALATYIRPQTFPLALCMVQEGEVPERARRPRQDLGFAIPVCQGIGMARRYGWTLALDRDDSACPYGSLALGFEQPKPGFVEGTYRGGSPTPQAAARTAKAMKRLKVGQYRYLVASPLERATFEPHLILVYGNSAQVMRLVQGCLYGRGGSLLSTASGGMDCSDIIPQTILDDECHVILPCNGDRIFGLAQDHEMAFTIPLSKVEATIHGLEAGHRSGLQRYPIPAFMRFQSPLPESYNELMKYLKEGD